MLTLSKAPAGFAREKVSALVHAHVPEAQVRSAPRRATGPHGPRRVSRTVCGWGSAAHCGACCGRCTARGVQLVLHGSSDVKFRLGTASTAAFTALLAEMDTRLGELGVLHYGLSMTTLEEVCAAGVVRPWHLMRRGSPRGMVTGWPRSRACKPVGVSSCTESMLYCMPRSAASARTRSSRCAVIHGCCTRLTQHRTLRSNAPNALLAAQVFMRLSHDEAGVLQRPVSAD